MNSENVVPINIASGDSLEVKDEVVNPEEPMKQETAEKHEVEASEEAEKKETEEDVVKPTEGDISSEKSKPEQESSQGDEEEEKEEATKPQEAEQSEQVVEQAPQPNREEQETRLTELVATGRRSLKLNEIEKATEALSDAAELASQLYGDSHIKTFESLMYYGMAVLELAKEEAQLLKEQEGDQIEEADEDSEENQKEETAENDEDGKEDGEESVTGEKSDSMELAWELLENARCIVTAHVEQLESEKADEVTIKKWKLRKADVLVLLGEHGIADGKYSEAHDDFLVALQIQKELLPVTSRLIAQTNLLIGNAFTLDCRYTESIPYHTKAKEVLELKVDELKKQLENGAEGDEKAKIEAEVKELEELIPGIDSSIVENTNAAAEAEEVKNQLKAQFEKITSVMAGTGDKCEEPDVNDITSLVRRPSKRPPTEHAESSDVKKPKEEGETSDAGENANQ